MTRRQSRGEADMDAQLSELDPSSERYQVLVAARTFKAAWVELGETLTLVREKNTYKGWGYASFDAYCRRELRIKQDTANKLTRSYAFLRDHEPEVLAQRETQEMPSLDVVDLLSQAKERTKLSDDQLVTLREEVFAPEAKPPSRTDVIKKLREHDPEAFKPAAKSAPATAAPTDQELRKTLLLAERLESLLELQGDAISKEALGNAHFVVQELRERFAQTRRLGAA